MAPIHRFLHEEGRHGLLGGAVQPALPRQELRIVMEHVAEEQRRLQFTARGSRYDYMLEGLQHAMFGVA